MANGTLAVSQLEMLSQSGTGIITITPPATNTNRAITLPDAAGAIVVSGTTPSLNGITFPATQVASAGANTLDDYEEGTWTTTFQSPTNLTGTPTLSGATYTKIGRLVTLTGSITGYTVTSSNTLTYPVFNVPFSMVGGVLSPLSGAGILSIGAIFVCGAFVDNSSGDATSVALVFPAVGMTTSGATGSITFTLVYQTS
jgi:hypothetical protein